MTIDKLERTMWRLTREQKSKYTFRELERAIMHEIGTDDRTYRTNRKALIKLGWIRSHGSKHIIVTGKHITDA